MIKCFVGKKIFCGQFVGKKIFCRQIYLIIPNWIPNITNIKPTINDVRPDFIESSPRSGPTVLSSTTIKGVGRAPDLSNRARSVAS